MAGIGAVFALHCLLLIAHGLAPRARAGATRRQRRLEAWAWLRTEHTAVVGLAGDNRVRHVDGACEHGRQSSDWNDRYSCHSTRCTIRLSPFPSLVTFSSRRAIEALPSKRRYKLSPPQRDFATLRLSHAPPQLYTLTAAT